MKLVDYIKPSLGFVVDGGQPCEALLDHLATSIADVESDLGAVALREALLSRERQGSTGTPEGIALPHAMLDDIDRSFVAAALVKGGADFRCAAGTPSDIVFVLVGPKSKAWEHVRLLARIARICHRPGALTYLRGASDGADLHRRLVEEDQRHV